MWIKRQMIMLLSKNGNSKIGLNPSALFNKPHLYYFNGGAVYHECQHLYIVSDEEITHNDWVLLPNNEIHKMSPTDVIHYLASQSKATKKIIATTDTSLGLPQPSQQFIEKYIEEYNKGNQIKEVMVEYETSQITKQEWFQEAPYRVKYDITTLKVKSDNTITIRKIKDSWSREEVIELLIKAIAACNGIDGELHNKQPHSAATWIEKNL